MSSVRLLHSRLPQRCSCQSIRSITTTTTSTSTSIPSTPLILASSLLSRSPLVLPPLTPLEKSYYNYQSKIQSSLSLPLTTSSNWFFKSGTTAQKNFLEFEEGVKKETGGEVEGEEFKRVLGNDLELNGGEKVERGESDLERKGDRTLYCLIKEGGKKGSWSFPQSPLNPQESLQEASLRLLKEKLGPNVDIWPIGKVPAGSYEVVTKGKVAGSRAFVMPMRIVRGSPTPGLAAVEVAWLTKEEIKEKVQGEYWDAVEGMLSEC